MQESDGNVIGNKLKFLNISDEDDDGDHNHHRHNYPMMIFLFEKKVCMTLLSHSINVKK